MFDFAEIILDKESSEPLHIQLSRELRRLIRAMDPETYGVLPSERTLCNVLDLHRKTVHKAYEELLESGIVSRKPDKSLKLNSSARKRLEGSLPAIGIVLPCRFSKYISYWSNALQYLKGIFDRAAERNYAVFLQELPPPEIPEEERNEFIRNHFSGLTGILLLGDRGYAEDPMLSDLFHYSGIPQVAIAGEVHLPHTGSVLCRYSAAAEKMSDFFREKGVKTLGIVDFPERDLAKCEFDYASGYRVETMKKHFRENGFELPEKWSLRGDFTEKTLPRLLPDAIWCCNDTYALHLLEILRKRGDEHKVLVGGFDGLVQDPLLHSICQPYEKIGAEAVDLLLELFEHGITTKKRIRYVDAVFGPTTHHEKGGKP